jgi:hypothetical protein
MSEAHRDDEYVALLRSRLPDEAHKERMRARLAALGVGGATLAAGSAQAALGATAALKLSLASKVFLAVSSLAVLGGSAYLATTTTASPRRERAVIAPAEREVVVPAPAIVEPLIELAPQPAPAAKPHKARLRAPLDTLSAENELLAAAVRALNAGDSAEAERLLDEHERRHPSGVLRDERERARRRLTQPR